MTVISLSTVMIYLVITKGGGDGFVDKTVWDWLELVIIPFALAIGMWMLNYKEQQRNIEEANRQKQIEREVLEERARLAREIEQDRQQQEMLSRYLDQMADLLINHSLMVTAPDSNVRMVARAMTLSNLHYLSSNRNIAIIKFLLECGLMTQEFKLVDLDQLDLEALRLFSAYLGNIDFSYSNLKDAYCLDMDFTAANFSYASLEHAYFSNTNLTNVDFSGANLQHIFFINTNLTGASFEMAMLEDANIDGMTILPDGREVNISGPLSRSLVDMKGNKDSKNSSEDV